MPPSPPVPVWDLPVRLFHWLLVALVIVLMVSGMVGGMGLHVRLGPWVLVLLLFRLVWGFVGSSTARFTQFVRGPGAILAYVRAARSGHPPLVIGHNPLGAYSVLALLGLTGLQAVSGLFTSDDIATDGPLIALHVTAVMVYTFVKRDNLIIPMLTGRKVLPDGQDGITPKSSLLALGLLALAAALVLGLLSRV